MMNESTVLRRETVGLRRYTDAFAPYAVSILRVLVGLTFLLHGFPRLGKTGGFAGFLTSLGVPAPDLFAVLVIAWRWAADCC